MHFRFTLICIAVVVSSISGNPSQEPMEFDIKIGLGKRLRLHVGNLVHAAYRWRRNGGPVSEKCEITSGPNSSILICPDFDWSDEGQYEYHVFSEDGQSQILMRVNVKVVDCTEPPAKLQQKEEPRELKTTVDECFCSGITNRCRKAEHLFRKQIIVYVTEAHMVDLTISNGRILDIDNKDVREAWTYYELPVDLTGNLLKSYGGYFEYPNNDDDVDEDSPDVILKGHIYTVVYHNRRELLSEESGVNKIAMREENWRHLNGSGIVSKHVFMAVLSKVDSFYLKSNLYRQINPLRIVLDSADEQDHGLGTVKTVEECHCREGYTGLSCESCAPKYRRRSAVGIQGICVSMTERLKSLKVELGLRSWTELTRGGV
ncbi:laminin subunit alpha-2-like [Sabethes cyaneus]|uniref:laminin subunit alpha-2-like n=1 Tax=Sabethes cyaneus TaxID=53552 RepID=UPI00237DEB61|nr:laminin subunit alpha-2-like [Sabethes cyaneus]